MTATTIPVLLALVATASCSVPEPHETVGPGMFHAPAPDRIAGTRRDSAVPVAWNELAYRLAFGEDQFLTFKGHRTVAMMNLAMHDALNTIRPTYDRYAYLGARVPDADPIVAAAQAAYDVLISQYPGGRSTLEAELARWLGGTDGGPRRQRSIALGGAAAVAILAARDHDAWNAAGSYEFREAPGEYQTTPPWNGFVAQPGFRSAKPFALSNPAQYRPPPPPALASSAYATALNEVKAVGAAGSAARTADQTAYAVWWMEFAEGSVSRLARELISRRRMTLWESTRFFAQLSMGLFDVYVAVWDSKYEYNHWRPFTAVRQAESDGNPATAGDASWEPLRPTPPFPDYVSAHAAACGVSFDILRRALGDGLPFTMNTITAPPGMPTRSFGSFSAAAAECADSRVRLGWHFRYSTDAGLALGGQVAAQVAATLPRPAHGRQ